MQIIKTFALVLFLFIVAQLKAQQTAETQFQDIVHLKNGSRLIGQITYYQPDDSLRLTLSNGQTLHYAADQVKKVQMYAPNANRPERMERPYSFREKGFYNAMSYALNFGRHDAIWGDDGKAHIGVGIQNVAGYMFHRLIGAGLGVGFDSYYISGGKSNVLSVFGEARTYLRRRNVSEYISLAAGYGHPLKNKNDIIDRRNGDFMIQPTVGLRFGASRRYNFYVDLGARVQRIHFFETNEPIEFPTENHYTVTYWRWVLRGGILF